MLEDEAAQLQADFCKGEGVGGPRVRPRSSTHFESLVATNLHICCVSDPGAGPGKRWQSTRRIDGFSVIIPAYNVSGIIDRAIRSAAAQSCPPFEILVIDDCSTDNTVDVVKALARTSPSSPSLNPANSGPSAAQSRTSASFPV